MAEMDFPNLSGKVILVYLVNRSLEECVLLTDASFEIQGGKVFLVGKFAEMVSANDWIAGVKSNLSWDCVEHYYVFDSMEDYTTRASKAYEYENKH